jgi:glycerol-3-phosphate cytidylyltransferase
MIIGYTTGVFDLFHVGHLNILRNARAMCDRLIVGVSIDELVSYKGKKSVIPFEERIEIVRSCKYVDVAVAQKNMDKMEAHDRYRFNLMFVGDDWFKTEKWNEISNGLEEKGVRLIYFPYTDTTSSSLINETLKTLRNEC